MKRRVLWGLWAMVPVAAIALHFGPGQRLLAHDRAGGHLSLAREAAAKEDWSGAAEQYAMARELLPEEDVDARERLELAEARAKIESGEFVEASAQLDAMLDRELASATPREWLVRELRGATAESSYYTAWVMRLEGAAEDEWRPETDKARQQYRLLAESATGTDGADAVADRENLESVIRLEQMDLSELKALPLPKKCKCCSNCCQKKREQRLSKCEGKKPSDNRKDINTNAAGTALSGGKGS